MVCLTRGDHVTTLSTFILSDSLPLIMTSLSNNRFILTNFNCAMTCFSPETTIRWILIPLAMELHMVKQCYWVSTLIPSMVSYKNCLCLCYLIPEYLKYIRNFHYWKLKPVSLQHSIHIYSSFFYKFFPFFLWLLPLLLLIWLMLCDLSGLLSPCSFCCHNSGDSTLDILSLP